MAPCLTGETCEKTATQTSGKCWVPSSGGGIGGGGIGGGIGGGKSDPAGQYCTSYSTTSGCPFGYYCMINKGYNPYQVGSCAKTPSDFPVAAGGNTPNGPWSGIAGSGTTATGPGATAGSCKSACGYQTLSPKSTCWCDDQCDLSGDCCGDRDTECPWIKSMNEQNNKMIDAVAIATNTPISIDNGMPPACSPTNCEASSFWAFENGAKCHCDAMCKTWKDCCHDFDQHCS